MAWRTAFLSAAVLVAATCLAACGGGGNESTAPAATPESGPTSVGAPEAAASEPSPKHPKSEARKRAAYEKTRYGYPSHQSAPFSHYSGKGKSKLHLAEFGTEAGSGERGQAQAVLDAYLRAIGEGDWKKACSYLSAPVRGEVAQLPKAPEGSSCGEVLREELAGTSEESSGLASGGIASLRIEEGGRAGEGAGFALFHGSDGADHWMAMKIEDGAWKVISTTPQPFS